MCTQDKTRLEKKRRPQYNTRPAGVNAIQGSLPTLSFHFALLLTCCGMDSSREAMGAQPASLPAAAPLLCPFTLLHSHGVPCPSPSPCCSPAVAWTAAGRQ